MAVLKAHVLQELNEAFSPQSIFPRKVKVVRGRFRAKARREVIQIKICHKFLSEHKGTSAFKDLVFK